MGGGWVRPLAGTSAALLAKSAACADDGRTGVSERYDTEDSVWIGPAMDRPRAHHLGLHRSPRPSLGYVRRVAPHSGGHVIQHRERTGSVMRPMLAVSRVVGTGKGPWSAPRFDRTLALAESAKHKPRDTPVSDTFSKDELISGVARRRRFSTEPKLAVAAETMQPGMSIS